MATAGGGRKRVTSVTSEQWIRDETRVHERAAYGNNKHAVDAALVEQTRRLQLVNDYESDVADVIKDTKVCGISFNKTRSSFAHFYADIAAVNVTKLLHF